MAAIEGSGTRYNQAPDRDRDHIEGAQRERRRKVITEAIARKILAESIQPDKSLHEGTQYLHWNVGDNHATLDAEFSADELEAIAWWMRHNGGTR